MADSSGAGVMDFVFRIRPDALEVLGSREIVERLSWYFDVMKGKKPAKFILTKKLGSGIRAEQIASYNTQELWELHDRLHLKFLKILEKIKNGEMLIDEIHLMDGEASYLDVKIELSRRMLTKCELCEWRCGIDRTGGKVGVCRVNGSGAYVDTHFIHLGEEAPLVPSGTIFYVGCSFRCAYCQNWTISQRNPSLSELKTPEQLARIQEELSFEGARNINHVGGEPTPHLPFIISSLKHLNVNIPQLWNSNFYMSEEAINLLLDVIDIWLPDFKYGSDECAYRLSSIRNYVDTVKRNLLLAHEHGDIIIRHLVLPGHIECCTKRIIEWVAAYLQRALLNIMDQYRPDFLVTRYPERWSELKRTPDKEVMEAYEYALRVGLSPTRFQLWFKK